MEVNRIQDDSNIWKKKGLVSPEIVSLTDQIRNFDKAVTYEIKLEKPYKSLKTYLRKFFADQIRLNIKRNDTGGQVWYIRIDPRPQPSTPRKAPIKKKASQPAISMPTASPSSATNS
jgi:hypothetical protein